MVCLRILFLGCFFHINWVTDYFQNLPTAGLRIIQTSPPPPRNKASVVCRLRKTESLPTPPPFLNPDKDPRLTDLSVRLAKLVISPEIYSEGEP